LEQEVLPEAPPVEEALAEAAPAAEGEAIAPAEPTEPVPTPEPVFETIQETVEIPEHAIISNGKEHSTILIRTAEREDTAIYRMSIQVHIEDTY